MRSPAPLRPSHYERCIHRPAKIQIRPKSCRFAIRTMRCAQDRLRFLRFAKWSLQLLPYRSTGLNAFARQSFEALPCIERDNPAASRHQIDQALERRLHCLEIFVNVGMVELN